MAKTIIADKGKGKYKYCNIILYKLYKPKLD